MAKSHLSDIDTLGFERAGTFNDELFDITPAWKGRQVVYLWTRGPEAEEILRVGIACGPSGLAGRYASYNRWLDGRFKPEDAAEQFKAGLFRQKLDKRVTVWAKEIEDKGQALRVEKSLRDFFGPALELDLMTDGWAKQEMRGWRQGNGAGQVRLRPTARVAAPASMAALTELASTTAPALKGIFSELDAGLRAAGLTPSQVRGGWAYKLGGRSICRVDPKPSKGCLRVEVGRDAEAGAPLALREMDLAQRGWLSLWPKDRALAVGYVLKVVHQRLQR